MSIKAPTETHKAFRLDAIALLKKYTGELDAIEMLAMAAHLVGQIIAMQDQRKMTREIALETVLKNIERGNAEVIAELRDKAAGSG
jgi:hypothetical protein